MAYLSISWGFHGQRGGIYDSLMGRVWEWLTIPIPSGHTSCGVPDPAGDPRTAPGRFAFCSMPFLSNNRVVIRQSPCSIAAILFLEKPSPSDILHPKERSGGFERVKTS